VRRVLGKLLTVLCVAALVFVVAAIIVPALFGLQRFVITGGSMTGTIPKGAVIYSRITPVEQLRSGDIITFTPPGFSTAVTHRVIAVESGSDGRPAFRTKGDFNETADPWGAVTLDEPQQARYVFQVPLLGYVLAALSARRCASRSSACPRSSSRSRCSCPCGARRETRSRAGSRTTAYARRPEPGVSRRVVILLGVAVLAVAAAWPPAGRIGPIGYSSASYTSSSQSDVTASRPRRPAG